MLIDSVDVAFHAGKGGDGIVSWTRAKYIPKGGPAGGDGGNGGSITLIGDDNIFSLESLCNRQIIKAEDGFPGGSANKYGKSGKSITINLPLGTLVKDIETGEVLVDIIENKQKYVLCTGGRGGKGNTHFKSSTNRAPTQFTKGTPGESFKINLELKLIADVGFVGFPNAGKSTLLSSISGSHLKVAAYPFTTLDPNVREISFDDYSKILIADIPGIIKDAHLDRGLGLSFLKHIERTHVLAYIIDASAEDPFSDFLTLQNELKSYNPTLLEKEFVVILNKIDLEGVSDNISSFKGKLSPLCESIIEISAKNKDNLTTVVSTLKTLSQKHSKRY